MHSLKYSLFVGLLFLAILLPAYAFAQDTPEQAKSGEGEYSPIEKNQFRDLLIGKTIVGEYRFMRERTKTYNFRELHNKDGTTDYREGHIKTKGTWYVLGERKICYKYQRNSEMGGQTSCFWVYESGGCYYGYGLSEMNLERPRDYNDWVARWVLKGSGASCSAPVS